MRESYFPKQLPRIHRERNQRVGEDFIGFFEMTVKRLLEGRNRAVAIKQSVHVMAELMSERHGHCLRAVRCIKKNEQSAFVSNFSAAVEAPQGESVPRSVRFGADFQFVSSKDCFQRIKVE